MTEFKGQWGHEPRTMSGVFWDEPPKQGCEMWDWTYVASDPSYWPPQKIEEVAPSTQTPLPKPADNRPEMPSYTVEVIYEKYT